MNYNNPNGYGPPPGGNQGGYQGGYQGGPPQGGGYGPPVGGYGAPPQMGLAQQNPYAAPQAFGGPRVFEGPAGDGGMKLKQGIFGGLFGGIGLIFVGAFLTAILGHSDAAAIGLVPVGLGYLAMLAGIIFYYVWMYKSWAMIPESFRMTAAGTRVTPGTAIGYMFIPFYNLYWTFVTHTGLCDALDSLLMAKGSSMRAPRGIAIATCISFFIPYLGGLVGGILAIIYIVQVDRAKAEYLRLAANESGHSHGMQPY